MKWSIEFYVNRENKEIVKDWINSLENNAKTKVNHVLGLLKSLGLSLPKPHKGHLEGKLYELRIKDLKGIYRIIYFAHSGKRFILLHSFVKKTQKTPRKEIAKSKNEGSFRKWMILKKT